MVFLVLQENVATRAMMENQAKVSLVTLAWKETKELVVNLVRRVYRAMMRPIYPVNVA